MKIAFIGFGTVGRGAYDIIKDRADVLKDTIGEIEVAYIVSSNRSKEKIAKEVEETVVTAAEYETVLKEVDLVAEATGAVDAAYDYMKQALEAGVAVVTANKAAVSAYYKELTNLSKKTATPFLFEAAVAGGIPVLAPLRGVALENEIQQVQGILNGTCNYLINAMFDADANYDDTLAKAQALGYAEQDPTDDVEGFDTRRKLHLLTELCFGHIDGEAIATRGISQLNGAIVSYLKENHLKVKLVASAKKVAGGVEAVVEPVVLKESDALAILPDAINQVNVEGNWVGELAFTGPGAGKEPTGNAIVQDIMTIKNGGVLPLIERDDVNLLPVKGRYLVQKILEGEMVDKVDGEFTITKDIRREDLLNAIDETTFFARIEV